MTPSVPPAVPGTDLAVEPGRGGSATALDRVARHVDALVARGRIRGRVYLLLDRSASMGHDDKLGQVHRGAIRFFYEAWKLEYAVGAIAFHRTADVLSGATRDPARFAKRLRELHLGPGTQMSRAMGLAIRRLRFRSGERSIILITDGMPDDPSRTLAAAARARALGIAVVAVGTDHADLDFLAALTQRRELAVRVDRSEVEARVGDLARLLPTGS